MVSGLRGKGVGLVRLFAKKWGGEFYESFVAGKVTHAVVRTNNMRCDRTLKLVPLFCCIFVILIGAVV